MLVFALLTAFKKIFITFEERIKNKEKKKLGVRENTFTREH